MKCSNPGCNRGIGLIAYQRGWFSKGLYCSKHCRNAFVADAPNLQQNLKNAVLKRFAVAFVAFVALVGLIVPATLTIAGLAAPPAHPEALHMPGCDRDADTDQRPQRRGQIRNMHSDPVLFFGNGKGARSDRTVQKRC